MRAATLPLLLAAIVILVTAHGQTGEAAWRGLNGRILYNDANHPGIWIMDADGGNRTQLTTDDTDRFATWSPDAAKIAFQRGFYDVWTMDPDGANAQMIAPGETPSWSTDGSRIVFSRNGLIMEMDAGGANEKTLTKDAGVIDMWPAYQPGGDLIAILRSPATSAAISAGGNPTSDIFLMSPDGTVETVTETTGYYEGWADWSPDGNSLVYRGPSGIHISTIGSAGPSQVVLPRDGSLPDNPSWSPDGSKIAFSMGVPFSAFTRGPVSQGQPAENAEIWIMDADGENPHVLPGSQSDPLEYNPDWGTTGGQLVRWGDSRCDGDMDTTDALTGLRVLAGLAQLSQTEPCPDVGTDVDVAGASIHIWGDANCGGALDALDALAVLRLVAGLSPLAQTEPCPHVGDSVLLQ